MRVFDAHIDDPVWMRKRKLNEARMSHKKWMSALENEFDASFDEDEKNQITNAFDMNGTLVGQFFHKDKTRTWPEKSELLDIE